MPGLTGFCSHFVGLDGGVSSPFNLLSNMKVWEEEIIKHPQLGRCDSGFYIQERKQQFKEIVQS